MARKLLVPVDTIIVPPAPSFRVEDRFRVNVEKPAEVRISIPKGAPSGVLLVTESPARKGTDDKLKIEVIGRPFVEFFGGMIVPAHTGSQIQLSRLTKAASDADILLAIGNPEATDLSLSEVYGVMCSQSFPDPKMLMRPFYVRDKNGIRRAVVFMTWGEEPSRGWAIAALALDGDPWDRGSLVPSRV